MMKSRQIFICETCNCIIVKVVEHDRVPEHCGKPMLEQGSLPSVRHQLRAGSYRTRPIAPGGQMRTGT
jgi:hypothetical protein